MVSELSLSSSSEGNSGSERDHYHSVDIGELVEYVMDYSLNTDSG